MARKLSIAHACILVAAAVVSMSGCFGRGGDTGAAEDRERARLAGIYGTWTGKDGFVVVLLADRGGAVGGSTQISGIPGEISGRIMIKDPGGALESKPEEPKTPADPKAPVDPKVATPAAQPEATEKKLWKQGVYKVVGKRVLARSTTEEVWAVSFTCELNVGKLFMATGDGKETELFRTAKPEIVKTDVE